MAKKKSKSKPGKSRSPKSRSSKSTKGRSAKPSKGKGAFAKKKSLSKKKSSSKKSAKKSGTGKGTKSKSKRTRKDDSKQRLQRVMASAGIASRRECELIIEEGRVEVDGNVVTQLGVKVDPYKQSIMVDAQPLVFQKPQYFILNKPPGVLSTSKDPSGRPRVIDLIRTDKRVYNVGRLDKASEGLILVTNDGELANRLTHPRYGIEKKYHVQVSGIPAPGDLRKLEKGVYLAEGVARAAKVKFIKKAKNGSWLEMVLEEGRNREIRRMLALIGHKVRTLRRVAIGPLRLKDLPLGAHRPLTSHELRALKTATSVEIKQGRRKKKAKGAEASRGSRKPLKPFDRKSLGSKGNKNVPKKPARKKSRPKRR